MPAEHATIRARGHLGTDRRTIILKDGARQGAADDAAAGACNIPVTGIHAKDIPAETVWMRLVAFERDDNPAEVGPGQRHDV